VPRKASQFLSLKAVIVSAADLGLIVVPACRFFLLHVQALQADWIRIYSNERGYSCFTKLAIGFAQAPGLNTVRRVLSS
jgi:hypothetical protein